MMMIMMLLHRCLEKMSEDRLGSVAVEHIDEETSPSWLD